LKADGTIVAWGKNDYDQCAVSEPNQGFVSVDGGGHHAIALKADSSVVAWGANWSGQCEPPTPNSGFIAVSAGVNHNLGLKVDGSVVAWGDNSLGECDVPAPNSDFVAISGGRVHSLGLKANGTVVAWGSNDLGQLNVPPPNMEFIAASAGDNHSVALRPDSTVACWGWNLSGQCNPPVPNTGFVAVSGGGSFSAGLSTYSHPTGACCDAEAYCSVTFEAACQPPGTWLGAGALCDTAHCVPVAAAPLGEPPLRDLQLSSNPGHGGFEVRYHLLKAASVRVEIADASGALARRLSRDQELPGVHRVFWNARDDRGRVAPAGVYFVRVKTGSTQALTKLVLVH